MRNKKSVTKIRLRNSTRAFFVILALVLLIVSIKNIYTNSFEKKEIKTEKKVYDYSNKYNLDYVVNIKPNNFILEENLPKDKTYISELIKTLSMKIDYKYDSSKNTKVKYDYKIDAILCATYTDNGENYEILNKVYNLKDVEGQEGVQNIYINENIDIDYQKYHKEIKQFEQSMGMSVDAHLYIKLIVNTSTKIDEQDVNNTYTSDFSITVGDKIAKVDGKNFDNNEQYVTDKVSINNKCNFI